VTSRIVRDFAQVTGIWLKVLPKVSDSQISRKLNRTIAGIILFTANLDRVYMILGTDAVAVLLDVTDPEPVELPVSMPPVPPVVALSSIAVEAAELALAAIIAHVCPEGQ
jgi:hypothetical protein